MKRLARAVLCAGACRSGFRQLGQYLDAARVLVGDQLLAAEGDQLRWGRRRSRPEAGVSSHGLAAVLVWHADDRGLADGRVPEQRVLDLPRPSTPGRRRR